MRNVIVTGGSRGLGLGMARVLATAGYRVDRHRAPGERTTSRRSCARTAGRAGPCISGRSTCRDICRHCRSGQGPAHGISGAIYGLVNNAGIGTSGLLARMHDAQIERLVRLNTVSPVILTKYVVRSMMADGGGRIVNVVSIVELHRL